MKKYIHASTDKFGRFKPIKSVTREIRDKIENPLIRKNVTSVWLVGDPSEYVEVKNPYYDPEEDEDYEEFDYIPKQYYMIFFKPRTMFQDYDQCWTDSQISEVTGDFETDIKDMNGWLSEIITDPKYYPELNIVPSDPSLD